MRYLLLLWFLFLLFHDNTLVISQCLNDQKALLLQLKQTIHITSVTSKLNSWVSNTDCCSWQGISCDVSGYVISLNLGNEFASSALVGNTSTLFRLRHLQQLNLAYNNFNSTPIPTAFGRLLNLTHLNLSNSGFSGQVPIEISYMKRLVFLDLSTIFASLDPLKLEKPDLRMLVMNLLELQELYLDSVSILGHGNDWCEALSGLPKLRKLRLSNCKLSGPFHESMSKLNSLSELGLDQNNFSAPLPEFFGNFSNLTYLHLSTCELMGKFPEKIFQLPLLQSLDISFNLKLYGNLPELPPNGSLQSLVLSNTNFSGKLPDSMGNLRLLTNLKLTACAFEGPIPSSISNLTQLIALDFSSNHFSGPVPFFGLSGNITRINLAHNNLTGQIPSKWERNTKLETLNVRNNSLNGKIPSGLFRLPLLQKLDLSENEFTGQLGEFYNASSSLDTVDISHNKLGGSIPLSISNLSGIKIFTASSNNFSGTLSLERFQKFKNLSSLDLSGNNLTISTSDINSALFPQVTTLKLGSCNLRTFPDFLNNQSTLNFLDISNNRILGRAPVWLWSIGNGNLMYLNISQNFLEYPQPPFTTPNFDKLAVIDLHSNLLQGPIPTLPPSASVLDYSNNNLTSTIPSDIGSNLSVAIYFSLSGNRLTGEIPESICNANYLQVLDLSNNSLSGSIPICLGQMEKLRVLNLRKNLFTGRVPQAFPAGCSLRTLDLNRNKLEGKLSNSLSNCSMLEVLDLGNNHINGTFPCWLGKLDNLRVLVLRSNNFSGPIQLPGMNSTFQMLQILDLSSNHFTGSLPRESFLTWKAMMMTNEEEAQSNFKHNILSFGVLQLTQLYYQDAVTISSKGLQMELVKILTIFTSIDLSDNRFEGSIPESIGNLTSLYVLNLSCNELTGPIPSSLGNLKQLESLDLSENKLSGDIPSQLAGLSFLSYLNLSFNELSGKIPSGRQFQTFNQVWFEGNEGLCGPPLLKSCSNSPKSPPQPLAPMSGIDFDWQFIVVGLGFGAGAGLAVCPLLFLPKGRKWYDKLVDRVVLTILPSPVIVYDVCDDWTSNTEESAEEAYWESTGEYAKEEGEDKVEGRVQQHGRYCVFCSKLDIRRKRAMHDPNCNCHVSARNSSSTSSYL